MFTKIFRQIFNTINASTCRDKKNLKDIIGILKKDEEFFIFFINIIIDFRINSLQNSLLLNFLDVYAPIDPSIPTNDIALNLYTQIKNHFEKLGLNSHFNFVPDEPHINVLAYDTFYAEHRPVSLAFTLQDLYGDPELYIEETLNGELGGAEALRGPYRKKTHPSGVVEKRIVWLAKRDQVSDLAEEYAISKFAGAYTSASREEKKNMRATAINDILGLGFKDFSLKTDKTLLLYLIFPNNFSNKCYKPTFVEGPLYYGYKGNYFLNAKDNAGYGLTNSTFKGDYEAHECITESVKDLTSDFQIGILGYAEALIDRTNMRNKAIARLSKT